MSERTGGLPSTLLAGSSKKIVMPIHIPWMSIALLHNAVTTLTFLATPEAGSNPLPQVDYRAKVKEHGTNCAIQKTPEGLVTQSRTIILTPQDDLKGFSKQIHAETGLFTNLPVGTIVFGEWCGPGVEAGMAVSKLPHKVFAIFAIQQGDQIIYEPSVILAMLGNIPVWMHVLPWEDVTLTIDFANPASLEAAATYLNKVVGAVEAEDPWIKRVFNVSGLGEGIVLYPVDFANPTAEALSKVMFKAKGEKHRTAAAKVAVQVAPTVVAGAEAFLDLMLTEARLNQGLTAVGGKEPRNTGKFIQWVLADVQKESKDELAVSNLTWDQVKAGVQTRARTWFLA